MPRLGVYRRKLIEVTPSFVKSRIDNSFIGVFYSGLKEMIASEKYFLPDSPENLLYSLNYT